jgi:hypothetical protein
MKAEQEKPRLTQTVKETADAIHMAQPLRSL